MSLVGNLQDLGLGEILQIVSLSRKSGTLALRSEGRTGTIVFRQGLVVRASSSSYKLNLGTILLQKQLVEQSLLEEALSAQREDGYKDRLGSILISRFNISRDIIEDVVCEQIESIVFSMFEWVTGSFDFVVLDYVETLDGIKMDPLQFMLDQGLNPQFLALEGSRIQDEKRLEQTAPAVVVQPAVCENENPTEQNNVAKAKSENVVETLVVVVDDDGPTLQVLSEALQELGIKVHAMSRSEDTIILIDNLVRTGNIPLLLVDLIMPKMDGTGVLGGIELLELLHGNFKNLPIIVMTDYRFEDAENKIAEMGYPVVSKPRRVEISDSSKVKMFMSQLAGYIETAMPGVFVSQTEEILGADDPSEAEDTVVAEPDQPEVSSEENIDIDELLEDFSKSDPQDGVLLLALRFASEFLGRAAVFMVQNNVITGVGQYGISGGKVRGDEIVRSIRIPVEASSIFFAAGRDGRPGVVRPEPTQLDKLLFEMLGGGIPEEVFIGPIVSKSRVTGFLYGDNLPGKKPIGSTKILETFLSHVGMTMEKNLLERMLQESGSK
jgi:CheY-like chemotaxis protein